MAENKTAKKATKKADGEAELLAKIAATKEPFRAMGKRLHTLILSSAPALQPTLWYGMPAYRKNGDIICFFRGSLFPGEKYMTFGLTQKANFTMQQLLESMWFITELDDTAEAKLSSIVRKAAS